MFGAKKFTIIKLPVRTIKNESKICKLKPDIMGIIDNSTAVKILVFHS